MGLGKRLKDILKKKNITVQRLSEMTGISANTLYTIIKRDNKSMQAENLINIARTLNVSIDELLGETMYVDTVENISALLSSGKATPADVAPVVHGRWIHYPDCGVTRCSHCGWSIEECWESNYCPNCGARMDGEESNDGTIL